MLGSVSKNVLHMVTYSAGTVSDKVLFFLPGPVTLKFVTLVSIIVYVLLGSFVKNFIDVLKVGFVPIKTFAMTIHETDIALDSLVGFAR